MAKVIGPFMSLDARGSIGKAITVQRLGKQRIAHGWSKAGRVNKSPATAAQLAQRKVYGAAVGAWRALSLQDKATWNEKGRRLRLTGWNVFVAQYMKSNDPYWSKVQSLLHFDGPNGSSGIIDETGASWVNSTPALLSSAQRVFGLTSLHTPGSSGITNAVGPTSTWMAADWTYECRAYTTDAAVEGGVWFAGFNDAWKIGFLPYAAEWIVYSPLPNFTNAPVVQDTWLALALQNKAGTLQFFIDGALLFSTAMPAVPSGATVQVIGNYIQLGIFNGPWPGWIDESRLTLGVARLMDGYQVATREFQNM